jgi:3',5'-cyclic AMP phosphodiesterase CpdA
MADLHYGLAPDAGERLGTITRSIAAHVARPMPPSVPDGPPAAPPLDFVIQLGDYCHAGQEHRPCTDLFNAIELARHHVLGNHDMDTCSKAEAVKAFGMLERYYSFVVRGWRFAICDLNHIRDGDRRLDYDKGNYYLESPRISWMDVAQLAWLEKTVATSAEPVVLISHQPIAGFAPALEASQEEIVAAVKRGHAAARDAGQAGVVLLLCGHLHVDVLSQTELGPSLCVNSASYHWANAMVPYAAALHTVLTLTPEGELAVEPCEGEWAPGADVARIPADRVGAVPRIAGRSHVALRARPD